MGIGEDVGKNTIAVIDKTTIPELEQSLKNVINHAIDRFDQLLQKYAKLLANKENQ